MDIDGECITSRTKFEIVQELVLNPDGYRWAWSSPGPMPTFTMNQIKKSVKDFKNSSLLAEAYKTSDCSITYAFVTKKCIFVRFFQHSSGHY